MSTATPSRGSPAHKLTGGNGSPIPEPPDRLARIEVLLESIEHRLDVQFQRIADIQAQLDRAIADRPINVTR